MTKLYKDMTSDEQFIYDAIDFVEFFQGEGDDFESAGWAIQVNGSGGFGQMQWCETMDGEEVLVVESILGNFDAKNNEEAEDEICFRARFILSALMQDRVQARL